MTRLSWALALVLFLIATAAASAQTGETYTDSVTGMELVLIPGGSFVMGNAEDPAASPERTVTVSPFFMGKHEVTFDQYAQFADETGGPLPEDGGWGTGSRPVINVGWNDAIAFTLWLSEKSGRNFRLPSEAQWEYAARGGTTTPYPWGEEIGENNANCRDCGSPFDHSRTAPVGTFAPNGYGLYDMTGNVYEWCLDSYHSNYQGAPSDGSIFPGGDHSQKIDRGGSWYRPHQELRVFQRCWDRKEIRNREIGFRVVLEP